VSCRVVPCVVRQIIASQANLGAADAVEMYVALLSYAGSVHPGELSYVDEVRRVVGVS
jgi:vacuolar protein sorting-associated protein 35